MTLQVTRAVIAGLLEQARAAHPEECCGILLGHGGAITAMRPARNVHPMPATHFEIDPQALIDAHRAARDGAGGGAGAGDGDGQEVAGYYHSHPCGPASPSATDRASASGDGRIWAIVAKSDIRFWRDGEQGFAALSYSETDG